MRLLGRRFRLGLLVLGALVASAAGAEASVAPRVVLVLPFDATALPPDHAWLGDGVAQVIALGLAQHPAFVQVDAARVRSAGRPSGEPGAERAVEVYQIALDGLPGVASFDRAAAARPHRRDLA